MRLRSCARDSATLRRRADRREIEPATVVGARERDRPTAGSRRDRDVALGRLAGGLALRGRFDAVNDGIAHELDQRAVQRRDHLTIGAHVATLEREHHARADRRSGVACRALERRPIGDRISLVGLFEN